MSLQPACVRVTSCFKTKTKEAEGLPVRSQTERLPLCELKEKQTKQFFPENSEERERLFRKKPTLGAEKPAQHSPVHTHLVGMGYRSPFLMLTFFLQDDVRN